MGYESKLVVVKKWNFKDAESFGETIAELNLCGMPNSFFPIAETFENELEPNKYIYMNDGENSEVSEDKYGDRIRFTTVRKLLGVLYKCEAEEHYRRTEMAINLLKSFTTDDWEDIVVFHYGY
jgi:hypothetical protein